MGADVRRLFKDESGRDWWWQGALSRFCERTAWDGECLVWAGPYDKDGYGVVPWLARSRAHQFAFVASRGPVPDGLMVCHTCDRRACVNPDHLYAGTAVDNARDMVERGRHRNQYMDATHCIRGHEFTKANTYVRNGGRTCRECSRLRRRERAKDQDWRRRRAEYMRDWKKRHAR